MCSNLITSCYVTLKYQSALMLGWMHNAGIPRRHVSIVSAKIAPNLRALENVFIVQLQSHWVQDN